MQRVYDLIGRADCVVIASPVYFSELTGRMLDMASRLQLYYSCSRFLKQALPVKRPKRGAVLLAGGGDGSPDRAFETARLLLKCMGVRDIQCASSLNTDELPAAQDEAALEQARDIGHWLSGAPE
jgi:multimeric flavodoxin WrbA